MVELEKSLTETLGTRVIIETNADGGRLLIDFFSPDDLSALAASLAASSNSPIEVVESLTDEIDPVPPAAPEETPDDELYSVSGFTV